jgi:DNA-binding beta-propeller fold protein YncE
MLLYNEIRPLSFKFREIMRSRINKELSIIFILPFIVAYGMNNVSAEYSQTLVTSLGTNGSGDGEFNEPHSIAFDSHDNMYITDEKNHRVQKFTSNGTFVTKWGTHGSGDGEFELLLGIDRDSSNNIYVVDQDNNNIQKFTNNGTFLKTFVSEKFSDLEDVELDSHDNIYVTDRTKQMILKFMD